MWWHLNQLYRISCSKPSPTVSLTTEHFLNPYNPKPSPVVSIYSLFQAFVTLVIHEIRPDRQPNTQKWLFPNSIQTTPKNASNNVQKPGYTSIWSLNMNMSGTIPTLAVPYHTSDFVYKMNEHSPVKLQFGVSCSCVKKLKAK